MAPGVTTIGARLKLTGQRAFSSGMRQVADDSSAARRGFDRIGGAAKKMGKSVGIGALALGSFGAVAAVGLGTKFIEDAEESRKIGRLTEAVIKSTGKAAKVTAKQVGDLAGAISNKTGVDDEAIQQGANMLLTFTNIRNEAGKGNKIFNRATQTITDMGAAMGKDPVKSAVMLGKALNDPLKGVTALSKVGVTFTADQKKRIAGFVKEGKVTKAQGVILDELAKEFGGAAAAQGSASDKLRVQFGNLSEDMGAVLLPYVDRFATWMGKEGVPLIERGAKAFGSKLGPAVRWVGDTFERVSPKLQRWAKAARPFLSEDARKFASGFASSVKSSFSAMTDSLERNSPWLKLAASQFKELAIKYGPTVASVIGKIVGFNFSLPLRTIGLLVDGIRLGIVGVSKFGRFTIDMFGKVLGAATKAFGWIPEIGDRLKTANEDFKQFQIDANRQFDAIDATFKVKVDTSEYDRFVSIVRGPGGLPVVGTPSSVATGPQPSYARRGGGSRRGSAPAPVVNLDGRRVSKEQDRVQAAQRAWR